MTEPDWPAAFYDQSGQLVDLQYNANSIRIVNHLSDGVNGKRCPKCNASPMYRTQLVWEENTRRHRNGMMFLTNIARRVAPPGRPSAPSHQQPVRPEYSNSPLVAGLVAVLVAFVAGPWAARQLGLPFQLPRAVLPVVTLICVGATIWWIYRRRKARWDAQVANVNAHNDRQTRRYEAALKSSRQRFHQWRNSWFCKSCSAIVAEDGSKPRPKPAQKPAARQRQNSKRQPRRT